MQRVGPGAHGMAWKMGRPVATLPKLGGTSREGHPLLAEARGTLPAVTRRPRRGRVASRGGSFRSRRCFVPKQATGKNQTFRKRKKKGHKGNTFLLAACCRVLRLAVARKGWPEAESRSPVGAGGPEAPRSVCRCAGCHRVRAICGPRPQPRPSLRTASREGGGLFHSRTRWAGYFHRAPSLGRSFGPSKSIAYGRFAVT